jgi:hypothetical protein
MFASVHNSHDNAPGGDMPTERAGPAAECRNLGESWWQGFLDESRWQLAPEIQSPIFSRQVLTLEQPSSDNAYLVVHAELLRRSYRALTGRDLIDPTLTPEDDAEALFFAPFVLLSHNNDPDPLMSYANRAGLALFELSWEQLVVMPSRLTAEAPVRQERERLLQRVASRGYIDDYSGIRISRSGRRFRIDRATIWNLTDEVGNYLGQAATFADWEFLD